jgi:hypothetical protein
MNIYIYIRIERRKKRTETFKRRKHSLTFSIIHLCFYSLADFLLLREKCTFKKQQTTNYKIELYKNTNNNNNPPAASAPCQMPAQQAKRSTKKIIIIIRRRRSGAINGSNYYFCQSNK